MDNFYILTSFVTFLISFLVTILFSPILIKLAKRFNLYDVIGNRKIHTRRISNLGGIGIIVGFIFSQLYFIVDLSTSGILSNISHEIRNYYFLLYALIILFIMGLIDDLKHISPGKKFSLQLLVVLILVWKVDLRIPSFHGLFGYYELPLFTSYLFTILVILFFINAYNLIDGLDGLSSSIGIYSTIIFSGIFYLNDSFIDFTIALSLLGSLVGFLIYNKPPAKIFMGDSGSLSIGLISAYFCIRVCNLPLDITGTISPVFAMIVLAYPAIDTLRSFFIRWYKGISPFKGDLNHIHYNLYDLGFGHGKSTLIILMISIILTIIAYNLRSYPSLLFFTLVPLIIFLSIIPSHYLNKKMNIDKI